MIISITVIRIMVTWSSSGSSVKCGICLAHSTREASCRSAANLNFAWGEKKLWNTCYVPMWKYTCITKEIYRYIPISCAVLQYIRPMMYDLYIIAFVGKLLHLLFVTNFLRFKDSVWIFSILTMLWISGEHCMSTFCNVLLLQGRHITCGHVAWTKGSWFHLIFTILTPARNYDNLYHWIWSRSPWSVILAKIVNQNYHWINLVRFKSSELSSSW